MYEISQGQGFNLMEIDRIYDTGIEKNIMRTTIYSPEVVLLLKSEIHKCHMNFKCFNMIRE